MRKLIVAAIAASIASVPFAAVVKAEDTTVIHKDDNGVGGHKTVIKKHEDHTNVVPREDKKVIIHHD